MKKTLYDYQEVIRQLPMKTKYEKNELLIPEFLIEDAGAVEIYYAPHNEYMNRNPKVMIIGITPGFQQMSTAIATARQGLEEGLPIETIQYKCKVAARFSGTLRKNIISMLDEIQLNLALGLPDCEALFDTDDNLLHTISLIPYPVFVKKQNYTGHTPKLLKNQCLMHYIKTCFVKQLQQIEKPGEVLLIPLGKAVEEVLDDLAQGGIIEQKQILKGFPHPSGANVNRVGQLAHNKESLMNHIRNFKGRL